MAGVDKSTVQGWESGRRPLGLVPAGALVTLRHLLLRLGTPPPFADAVDTAIEADLLIDHLLDHGRTTTAHSLAGRVLSRELVDMLTWPVKENRPAVYRNSPPSRRRGPVAVGPRLGHDEQRALFENLRALVETAPAGADGTLLRRQACYLASFDTSADTRDWLSTVNQRIDWVRHAGTWTPRWAEARSIATSLALSGDPEAVGLFVEAGRGDNTWEIANLNYFAYWVGEVRSHQRDDSFMRHHNVYWRGGTLLTHLADRLQPGAPLLELNVRTLWSLIAARRGLLEENPEVSRQLARQVSQILDSLHPTAPACRDLLAVQAALTLAGVQASGD